MGVRLRQSRILQSEYVSYFRSWNLDHIVARKILHHRALEFMVAFQAKKKKKKKTVDRTKYIKWPNTSSKRDSITAKFWMPKSSVPYRKLQTNYFLTKHFWPRRRLIFSTLPSVVVIIFTKMEMWFYQFVMWPTWVYVTSRFGASRGKLTPCLVSWSNATTNGDITYPVCGVTSQNHVTKESYDYWWKFLAVYHHPDKFNEDRHFDMEY